MKKAVFAGSFDPLTIGHWDIIKRSSGLFDELVVLININPDKKSFLTLDEKIISIEEECKDNNIKNVKVDTCESKYTVKYCEENDIKYLVRGIRNTQDFLYEENIANINKKISSDIETVLLFTDKDLSIVSSSTIKGLCGFEGWEGTIKQFLPFYSYASVLRVQKVYKDLFIDSAMFICKKSELLTEGVFSEFTKTVFETFYSELIYKYSILNKRHYHGLTHLMDGFNTMNMFILDDKQKALLTIAFFYHDFEYDTTVIDEENVYNSASRFENTFNSYFSHSDLLEIKKLILITAHKKEPQTYLERCICDMDLQVFAKDTETYLKCSTLIRKEYSQYDDETWNKGRKDFLNKMYLKHDMFHILPNIDTLELNMKNNIQFELKLLQDNTDK